MHALVASFALGLEDPDTALNYAIIRKIYGYPADYWDNYPARITAVTAADVQRVAKKYINADTKLALNADGNFELFAMPDCWFELGGVSHGHTVAGNGNWSTSAPLVARNRIGFPVGFVIW